MTNTAHMHYKKQT